MKNRKAFNFYRSYYDVVVELTDEQKVQFLMAILNKQFLDLEPKLDGLVGLLYKSQKHSIDAQVNGYKNKKGISTTEDPYQSPSVGGTKGPTEPPSVQEEEQGEVEGKGQVQEQVYEKNDFNKAKTKSYLCRELNITSTQFNRYIVEGNTNEYHNQKLLKQYENEINRYWN
jgi:hypothetical protein